MGKRREARSVFGTKLFCYRKENISAKRFWNKIVFLWEKKQKCEAFLEQNCCVMGKRKEVRSVFGTSVLLQKRKQKCEAFLEQNCSVMR